jgi:hypothetical protein
MGADGHIRLMDLDKLVRDTNMSDDNLSKFIEIIRDSMCYLQKLETRRIITNYWGDNIYSNSLLYNLAYYGYNKGNWEDTFYYDIRMSEIEKCGIDSRVILDWTDYLWNSCYITEWEVWT